MHVNDGQLVEFFGDSLTEHVVAVSDAMEIQTAALPAVGDKATVDRHENRGLTATLMALISTAYPELAIRYQNAGRGGDTSRTLLARLETDVLSLRPDWLVLSAGVVDVRRTLQPAAASEGVPLDEYTANLTAMTRQAQAAGAHVILVEPTPHHRPPTGALPETTLADVNGLTGRYGAAMAQVAKETGADFVSMLQAFLRVETLIGARGMSLHRDEVHLNPAGDLLYARLVYACLESA